MTKSYIQLSFGAPLLCFYLVGGCSGYFRLHDFHACYLSHLFLLPNWPQKMRLTLRIPSGSTLSRCGKMIQKLPQSQSCRKFRRPHLATPPDSSESQCTHLWKQATVIHEIEPVSEFRKEKKLEVSQCWLFITFHSIWSLSFAHHLRQGAIIGLVPHEAWLKRSMRMSPQVRIEPWKTKTKNSYFTSRLFLGTLFENVSPLFILFRLLH